MDVRGSGLHEGLVPPDAIQQLIQVVYTSGMAGEKLKKFEFAGTQFDRLTIHCHLIGFEINVKPPA
ncbi:MAG: hypothetical protein A2V65_08685 [Deltaproteobacteria bacterium RBG_13_49_15]|nr:MAG: hypothetical protein A2V65_08685 [Deltaproteobacteria bacterium RBG_13_49_15]